MARVNREVIGNTNQKPSLRHWQKSAGPLRGPAFLSFSGNDAGSSRVIQAYAHYPRAKVAN